MQGHRRRRVTRKRVPRDHPQPPSARRVAAGRHRFLCCSSFVMYTDIASSSLRELDAVALATNVTIFMERDTKLAAFCTAPAISNRVANFVTEVIATAMLLFGILAISANSAGFANPGEVDLSVVFRMGLQPLLVGLLVWSIGLSLGGPTGYAINPARDLGPRIAYALLPIQGKGKADWGYSWIPVFAPILGGVLGAWFFVIVGF